MTTPNQHHCYRCTAPTTSAMIVTEGAVETNVCRACYSVWPGAISFRAWADKHPRLRPMKYPTTVEINRKREESL